MSQEPVADAPSIKSQIAAWHDRMNAESKFHCEWLSMQSRFPEPPSITFMVHRLDKPMGPVRMTIGMRPADMHEWDDLAEQQVPISLEKLVTLAAGRAVADLCSREVADLRSREADASDAE